MITCVKKWGNSASVRIPAVIMQAAHLHLDQMVTIREEEGRIVIEPVQELSILLAAITQSNQHDEIDVGNSVGKEVW